VPLPIRTR